MSFLQTIIEAKKREVERLQQEQTTEVKRVEECRHVFCRALEKDPHVSLIAEIKKASPSAGVICEDLDPEALAKAYTVAGATAISVVTDQEFFQGSVDFLKAARKVTDLPILRKDFIIDVSQIYESAEIGANAILLIAAVLTETELSDFRELAESLDMDALVEVHDEEELEKALASGAMMIGVNNRDLKTFEVNLQTTFDLAERMPEGVVLVSESGVKERIDVAQLRGVSHGVLVGTSLLKSDDVEAKARELVLNRPLLKVCGVQDVEIAQFCEENGVDFIGLNFVKDSPRYVDPEMAQQIVDAVSDVKTVGLFVDEDVEFVNELVRKLELDFVQLHGKEDEAYCEAVECPIIKGFTNVDEVKSFQNVIEFPLLDLEKGSDGVIHMEKTHEGPYFLAGGLTPENVYGVVDELEKRAAPPLVVDVARGVETDGKKDTEKILKFINQLESC